MRLFPNLFKSPESQHSFPPPFFCLTLPEEPWKKEEALTKFHAHEISPVFVDGIQGVTVGLKPTNPYDYNLLGQHLYVHPSQLGCLISHRIALSVALSHGANEFIICEDDVILCDNFSELFLEFRSQLPDTINIAQLEYSGFEDKPQRDINDTARHVFYPFCAACIWWTRAAAKLAIQLLRPMDRPYDVLLIQRVFPFLNHCVAWPPLAGQRSREHQYPSAVGDAPKEDHRIN